MDMWIVIHIPRINFVSNNVIVNLFMNIFVDKDSYWWIILNLFIMNRILIEKLTFLISIKYYTTLINKLI